MKQNLARKKINRSKRLNNWGIVIGIIGTITGIILSLWALSYSKKQVDDLEKNSLRKEYENIVLIIEQGKTCKNQLIEKSLKGNSVTKIEKYECFKIDSISGRLLEKFIMDHETIETLSAIDYYIAYYDNKKTTNEVNQILYQAEIKKLKERRKDVLEIIYRKSNKNKT
jgi:hypothetical protein